MAGDEFMLQLHLGQPRFTYSVCGPFTKHLKSIQKFRETGYFKFSIWNELDQTCFAHDATCSDRRNLAIRTISVKILKEKAYEIALILKYDWYQKELASIVFKFFDQKTGSAASVNEEIAQELHKPVIKKFRRRKVYARFKENIWAADLAEMEWLSS